MRNDECRSQMHSTHHSSFLLEHSTSSSHPIPLPERVGAGRFILVCKLFSLAFLLITVEGKLFVYHHRGLPNQQDYPQYYMAGQIVRHGAWESLYPIPTNDRFANPGAPENSAMRPRYAAIAQQYG